mmetsp:Transcript_11964/g.38068  ORF Transcript_11964/g.38068 Transcript_11964/m.38068 type:complete len:246 (+) Transcript_11964:1402-2139(+)
MSSNDSVGTDEALQGGRRTCVGCVQKVNGGPVQCCLDAKRPGADLPRRVRRRSTNDAVGSNATTEWNVVVTVVAVAVADDDDGRRRRSIRRVHNVQPRRGRGPVCLCPRATITHVQRPRLCRNDFAERDVRARRDFRLEDRGGIPTVVQRGGAVAKHVAVGGPRPDDNEQVNGHRIDACRCNSYSADSCNSRNTSDCIVGKGEPGCVVDQDRCTGEIRLCCQCNLHNWVPLVRFIQNGIGTSKLP